MIFNPNVFGFNDVQQFNNFFQSELKFVQKSLNKKNNNIDESSGSLKRNLDNTIQIEIFQPYSGHSRKQTYKSHVRVNALIIVVSLG